jgi:hypothetical protein
MYRDGIGTERDLHQAKECYEDALAQADDEDKVWEPATRDEKQLIQNDLDRVNALLEEIQIKTETARKAARTEVFICYSREDVEYKKELSKHLEALSLDSDIKWWSDSNIESGEWHGQIEEALSKAKIAVLMISVDFLISEYIRDVELPAILDAAKNEGATVLLLLVRDCRYKRAGLDKYQFLANKAPIAKFATLAERDEEYAKIVDKIEEIYKQSNIE